MFASGFKQLTRAPPSKIVSYFLVLDELTLDVKDTRTHTHDFHLKHTICFTEKSQRNTTPNHLCRRYNALAHTDD